MNHLQPAVWLAVSKELALHLHAWDDQSMPRKSRAIDPMPMIWLARCRRSCALGALDQSCSEKTQIDSGLNDDHLIPAGQCQQGASGSARA